jgi:hypothetical protein
MTGERRVPGSFRDPSGFLFYREEALYRQINRCYQDNYDLLNTCGLYAELVNAGLLIPHREVDIFPADPASAYRVIAPEPVRFISYPYEWCFSQLRDAALTTLRIQQIALDHGMSLKDASAYNIQFHRARPVLIDTLSFEKYAEGRPWIGYQQFCRHFLAPLALMSRTDVRLGGLLRNHLDGIPLDLAARLLPARTKLSFPLLTHIHLHAKSQKKYEGRTVKPAAGKVSRLAMRGLIDNLNHAIKALRWEAEGTEWAEYYEDTNYTPEGFRHKQRLVAEFIAASSPQTVWDLGGNIGIFSRIAAENHIFTVCFDVDPAAVEKNYRQCRTQQRDNLLPLLCDLTNPSPGAGWNTSERAGLIERGPADTVLALALIHHLAISHNVPLAGIAEFLARLGRWVIIEFVPKDDSQVRRLLATREDIFGDYTQDIFEQVFSRTYEIIRSEMIRESKRTLYLLHAKKSGET